MGEEGGGHSARLPVDGKDKQGRRGVVVPSMDGIVRRQVGGSVLHDEEGRSKEGRKIIRPSCLS